jgi:SAM-dependent methyltransferase
VSRAPGLSDERAAAAPSLPMRWLRRLREAPPTLWLERTRLGRVAKELTGRLLMTPYPVRACDRCGGRDLGVVHVAALRTVVRCRACGLEFAAHIPPGGFDAFFGIFDSPVGFGHTYLAAAHYAEEPGWVRDTTALLDRLLGPDGFEAAALARGGSAYEIGCGNGDLLELLRRRGWRVRGGDAGAVCREQARARGLDVEPRTAGRLGALRDRFDLVVAAHLLEHVESPRSVLADLARRLAPGGRVLCLTPLRADDVTVQRRHHYGYPCYGHVYYFRREDLLALAAAAGLTVVTEAQWTEYDFPVLGFAARGVT